MAEGRSNRGIAGVLVVTVPAIERHVTNILGKLEVQPSPDDHRRVLAVLEFLHAARRHAPVERHGRHSRATVS
jgi:DNA-binding NarL/FixJ family response regulator